MIGFTNIKNLGNFQLNFYLFSKHHGSTLEIVEVIKYKIPLRGWFVSAANSVIYHISKQCFVAPFIPPAIPTILPPAILIATLPKPFLY